MQFSGENLGLNTFWRRRAAFYKNDEILNGKLVFMNFSSSRNIFWMPLLNHVENDFKGTIVLDPFTLLDQWVISQNA